MAVSAIPSSDDLDLSTEHMKFHKEGDDHLFKNEFDQAKELYLKAAACSDPSPPKPTLSMLHVKLATIYGRTSEWEKVIEHSNLAIQLNCQNQKAYFGRYRAYDAIGEYTSALEDIMSAVFFMNYKDSFYMQCLDKAIMKASVTDVDEFIKNQVPNGNSTNGVNTYFKTFCSDVVCEWWQGKIPEADSVEALRQAVKMKCGLGDSSAGDPGTTHSGFVAARINLAIHDYANIIDLCTEELESEKSEYRDEAHLLRGVFRLLWGYKAKYVLEDLEAVISSSTANDELKVGAWIRRGEVYSLADKIEEVNKSFESAQKLLPEHPDTYIIWCNVLMEHDLTKEAYAQICKAVEKKPDFGYAVGVMCFMKFRVEMELGENGKPLNAMQTFRENLAKFPKSSDMYVALGYFFKDLQEPFAAYMQFDRALEMEPDNMPYAVNKAMMEFEIKMDPAVTAVELNNILGKDEYNACTYEALATIYVALDDLDMALFIIDKGLRIARARHDFVTLCTLKKTAEIRKKLNKKFMEDIIAAEKAEAEELKSLSGAI